MRSSDSTYEGDDDDPFSSDDEAPISQVEERQSGICFRSVPEESFPTLRQVPAAMSFLGRIPVVCVSQDELQLMPLHPRAAFVISRIDGVSSVENVLDVCAMV